ncbi:MAG: hypothetical protein Q4G45_05640 [Actinomycetia bacterium]|nr:hypothetical protein [Actinomycetes bacterium]
MARVRVTGGSIFKKLVEPYLKRAAKHGGDFRGVLKKQIHIMPGVKVIDGFPYTKRSRKDMKRLRKAFDRGGRQKFLKSLKEADLRHHGFSNHEIQRIQSGRVPKGYQVHHKSPLDDSGTNSHDNLVLIRNSPEHQLISNHQRWVTRDLKVGDTADVTWPVFPPGTTIWPPHKSLTTTILP